MLQLVPFVSTITDTFKVSENLRVDLWKKQINGQTDETLADPSVLETFLKQNHIDGILQFQYANHDVTPYFEVYVKFEVRYTDDEWRYLDRARLVEVLLADTERWLSEQSLDDVVIVSFDTFEWSRLRDPALTEALAKQHLAMHPVAPLEPIVSDIPHA
jgi:hypothetical protein